MAKFAKIIQENKTINYRKLIFENANEEIIKEKAIELGMTPLRDAGIEKIINGETTIHEVLRSTVEDL